MPHSLGVDELSVCRSPMPRMPAAVFSDRELKFTFAIMSSAVRLSSVCLSSVTFVRPTQAIEIFANISTHLVPWPSMTFV